MRHDDLYKPRAAPETEKRQFEDEALETLWEFLEKDGQAQGGHAPLERLIAEMKDERAVLAMQQDGLLAITDGKVAFTEA
ncbi:MAG: hypothetical protein M0Z75_05665, partial [Nitrospiraceae bacterium]|nr:hypothetical protein [Nitrospiraceae bacterium]